jgi:hypothetical protein
MTKQKKETLEEVRARLQTRLQGFQERKSKARDDMDAKGLEYTRAVGRREIDGIGSEADIETVKAHYDRAKALFEFLDGRDSPIRETQGQLTAIEGEIAARDDAKRWADLEALGKQRDDMFNELVALLQAFETKAAAYFELGDRIARESPVLSIRQNLSTVLIASRFAARRLVKMSEVLTAGVRKAAHDSRVWAEANIPTAYAHLVKEELATTKLFVTKPSEPREQPPVLVAEPAPVEPPAPAVVEPAPEARAVTSIMGRIRPSVPHSRTRARGVPFDSGDAA